MDNTEYAHWCYRVRALRRDVDELEGQVRRFPAMAQLPEGSLWHKVIADSKEMLVFQRWLLEEARYKICLGEVERRSTS